MSDLARQDIARFFRYQIETSRSSIYTLVIESVRDSHENIENKIERVLLDITPALDSIITSTKDLKCLCTKYKIISFVVELDMRLNFLNQLKQDWLKFKAEKSDSSLKHQFLTRFCHSSQKFEVWTENFKYLVKEFDNQDEAILCQSMLNRVIE